MAFLATGSAFGERHTIMPFDYDLFVIGAGSGGVRASRLAAATGAKVAIAEELRVGGTCVLRGCIPKKLLVIASHFAEDFTDAGAYGWSIGETSFDWPALIAAKNQELDRLHGVYLSLLGKAGVTIVNGRAMVEGPHAVRVGDQLFSARHILIAVGGWPSLPDIPGIEHAITSNEALDLPVLPKSIAIVGGGYIAVEFAGIFAGLGVATTQILRANQLLRGFDLDVREMLATEMSKKHITLLTQTLVQSIARQADGRLLLTHTQGTLLVDQVLYATGRMPNTNGLGLEAAGVALDENGAVLVDAFSQSSVPSIHAIGDVTNRVALTPVAIAEAHCLVETLFKGAPRAMTYANIPSAVFSQPAVATVGLTEEDAIDRFGAVDIYVTRFRSLRHSLTGSQEKTLMKLVVTQADQKVVGAHMVGPDAPEIIQGVAIAVTCGATKQDFDRTIGIHPTAAEEFVTLREKRPT
jgi:glutathione reductase (NADPH)